MWRRGRASANDLDELAEVAGDLYRAFEINLERCGRLARSRASGRASKADRAEAGKGVVDLSWSARSAFAYLREHELSTETELELFPPSGAMGAVARLTYGLLALADEAPEPEALLSPEEIETLIWRYQLESWVALWRKADAETGANLHARLRPGEAAGR